MPPDITLSSHFEHQLDFKNIDLISMLSTTNDFLSIINL